MMSTITVPSLVPLIGNINIIDIRNSASYNNNHIPGAKNIEYSLLLNNPDKYLEKLGTLNTEFITFHPSTSKDPNKTIEKIKSLGINVGIAINPNEDIHMIDEYLDKIDLVLIMSVYPGKGGQEFIPEVLDKLDYLKDQNVIVSIDGGINNETIKLIADKKIDIIVSGSYVCSSDDFDEQIDILKTIY